MHFTLPLMESHRNEPVVLRVLRKFARLVGFIEGWIAVLSGGFFALMGGAAALALGDWKHLSVLQRAATVAGTAGWIYLDVPYLIRLLIIAIRRRSPFALTAAIERPMYRPALRPIIALWWFAHFCFCAGGAALYDAMSRGPRPDAHGFIVAAVLCGLAANGFLMLCVCTSTRSASIRMLVWRWRLLIDLLCVVAAAFIPA